MQVEVVNKKQARRRAGVWISRGRSVLGSPFPVDRTRGDQEAAHRESVDKYRSWLRQQYKQGGKVKAELVRLLALSTTPQPVATQSDRPHIHQQAEQHTLTLLCWCKPYPCHGDVIIEALQGMRRQQLALLVVHE